MLLLGLINGVFYALLSLGMAVIFGMLNIVNFAHGAFYMLGAFAALLGARWFGIGYWWALLLSPLVVGCIGYIIERLIFSRIYQLDHIYGFLLSFGMAIVIEGAFRNYFGSSASSYPVPAELQGLTNLGFMFVPNYRGWVVGVAGLTCLATWLIIERTSLGAKLRAVTENPTLTRAFGIRVQLLISITFAVGIGLAAFAGVLAAPIYSVHAGMGSNFVIVSFAVVVIGGMGSIMGTVAIALVLGLAEGLMRAIYPPAAATIVFILMIVVLLIKPAGLFGKADNIISSAAHATSVAAVRAAEPRFSFFDFSKQQWIAFLCMVAFIVIGPMVIYPLFLIKVLCFALFACAFNLLVGYVGLLSFGHAAFFGMGSYATAWLMKSSGATPELAMLSGALVAGVLGLLFGWIAIRRQGLYFAMITLGLAQMIYFFCLQAPFTGGEDGIQGVQRGKLFGLFSLQADISMYIVAALIFLAAFLFVFRVIESPFGNILTATRENEARSISLGYNVDRYKLAAFVISATLSGLAGSLKAVTFGIATLADAHFGTSGEIVLITLLGGLGTIFGPVVGALVLASLEYVLAGSGSWVNIIQGLIFIVCVLTFRRGIIGEMGWRLKSPL